MVKNGGREGGSFDPRVSFLIIHGDITGGKEEKQFF